MLDRMAVGEIARKPHTALRSKDNALRYEHCLTRAGFDGAYSILYHEQRPHALRLERSQKQSRATPGNRDHRLRRHFRTAQLADVQTASPTPLLTSYTLNASVWKPQEEDAQYHVLADEDALLFVREGSGILRSVFGDLEFHTNDYVCVPKGVLHRFIWRGACEVLRIDCNDLAIPRQFRNALGQLRMDAPYSHRDFRRPVFVGPQDEHIREVTIVRRDATLFATAEHSPLDVIGWDGTVYPWAFPILAFQPRVGSVHLPPTVHGTFCAEGMLVCSFVPRMLDFGDDAIPCPYPHSSTDIDEVIYYVSGEFGSRDGIEKGSITLHARGVPHGPQPGRYEASMGQRSTRELAVMLDCRDPLSVSETAEAVEDDNYETSFSS